MSTSPTDKFSQTAPIENTKPAGGEIRPVLRPVPVERPAPISDQFGGFKRN
jgi:hypothetical protein